MNLGWYLDRLRSMGLQEVAHRLAERARQLASRHRHEGWRRYPAPATLPRLAGLREAVLRAGPADREAIATAALAACDGRFEALGRRWPRRRPDNLFPPDLWRLDPVSGSLWPGPEAYCFAIDFRRPDGSRGDVKYVWEINRLQFLVPLAADVLLGHGESLGPLEAAIASWHAANPPFRGLGWAAGIEVALRSVSLLAAASLVGDRFSADTIRRIGEILAAGAFWLARFPSLHSSANNHRVAELAGLDLVARALGRPDQQARTALIAEIDRQILPDGVAAEQSPSYGAFTAELALLCASVARAAGDPYPPGFGQRLGAFAEYVAWLGGDGGTPSIGDDDEGHAFTLGRREADYPRSVAAAIAGHLGSPGPTDPPGSFRALLFGRPTARISQFEGGRTFEAGGVSVWHGRRLGRRMSLVFDHGPLGYLSIAAHGHSDALQVLLAVDGEPVLVDPGTFLYGSGGPWRSWFRSTPAHNTLSLEGQSQSRMAGAFNWSDRAESRLVAQAASPWSVTASTDGWAGRFGVHHVRDLSLRSDGLAIRDRLTGGGDRTAEIVFQLAVGLEAAAEGAEVRIARGSVQVLTLRLPTADIAIASGGDAPGDGGGWVSKRFGERLPAPRIAWRGTVGAEGVETLLLLPPPQPERTPR